MRLGRWPSASSLKQQQPASAVCHVPLYQGE